HHQRRPPRRGAGEDIDVVDVGAPVAHDPLGLEVVGGVGPAGAQHERRAEGEGPERGEQAFHWMAPFVRPCGVQPRPAYGGPDRFGCGPSTPPDRSGRTLVQMFVLGIDPGVSRCGYGCVEPHGSRARAVALGVLRTSPDDPLPQRLAKLQLAVRALVAELTPSVVAVERVFFQVNVRTAMAV